MHNKKGQQMWDSIHIRLHLCSKDVSSESNKMLDISDANKICKL